MVCVAQAGQLTGKSADIPGGRHGIGIGKFFLVSPVPGLNLRPLRFYFFIVSCLTGASLFFQLVITHGALLYG